MPPHRELNARFQAHVARARRLRIIGVTVTAVCLLVATGTALALRAPQENGVQAAFRSATASVATTFGTLGSNFSSRASFSDAGTQVAAVSTGDSLSNRIYLFFCPWFTDCEEPVINFVATKAMPAVPAAPTTPPPSRQTPPLQQTYDTEPSRTTTERTLNTAASQEFQRIPESDPPVTRQDVVRQYPVIERIIERVVEGAPASLVGYVTQSDLLAQIAAVKQSFGSQLYGDRYSNPGSSSSNEGIVGTIGMVGRIESLTGTELSDISVDGVSGLTDADIPDGVTASNYLPLTGGTITGSLSLSGTLTAGSLAVTALASGGAVEAPYFTATSTSASSTFTNVNATNATTTNATSTNLFATLGRFTSAVADVLSAVSATMTNLTSTTLVATNATTTRLDALEYVAVGRTATTTIRGDGLASTIPFASTTMITADTASSTNLWISALGAGGLLKTNANGQVAFAVAGTDYALGSSLFGKTWELINSTTLAPTSTLGILVSASSTIGDGTLGLTISGNSTTTGTAHFAGNVGIGTAAPGTKLEVSAAGGGEHLRVNIGGPSAGFGVESSGSNYGAGVYYGGDLQASWYGTGMALGTYAGAQDAPTGGLIVSGNVGIGTTSPANKLHIEASDDSRLFISRAGVAQAYLGDTGAANDAGLLLYDESGNLNTLLRGNGINYLNGGNVGIGTTSPTSKLSIQGLNSNAALGSELLSITADRDFSSDSGNWGGTNWSIGSGVATHAVGANAFTHILAATAGATYQIVFTVNTTATGTLSVSFGGVSGATVGQSVGTVTNETQVITTTGTGALIFTPNAAWTGTLDDISVKQITFSDSVQNIFNSDGSLALQIRGGGTGGFGSGGGGDNVFIGTNVGRANVQGTSDTGTNNTAVGYGTFISNTTGYGNSVFGQKSLQANTTGINNTAVGLQTLYSNTSGNYNVGLGNYALYYNTTGSSNTAIGLSALQDNTTGIGNFAGGRFAGYGAGGNNISTVDNYMVFLGYQASRDSSVLTGTSLTNGIAIGKNARVGASNTLVLGGTGADAVNVGIGTSTPDAKLVITDTNTSILKLNTTNAPGSYSTQIVNNYDAAQPFYINTVNGKALGIKANMGGDNNVTTYLGNFYNVALTTGAIDPTASNVRLFIDGTTGNVGIGTTTPGALFDVGGYGLNGSLQTVLARQIEGNINATGTSLGIRAWGTQEENFNGKMFSLENSFYGQLNSSIEFYRGGGSTGGFTTFTTNNGTERMRIDGSGNVGIGTTTPNAKLSIVDTAKGQLRVTGYSTLSGGSSNSGEINIGGGAAFENTLSSKLQYNGANGNLYIDNAFASDTGNINFRTRTSGATVDALTITGSGYVGIGTTTPDAKLTITNTDSTTLLNLTNSSVVNYPSQFKVRFDAVGSTILENARGVGYNLLLQPTTGNVGIGTTSPWTRLSVTDSTGTLHVTTPFSTGVGGGNVLLRLDDNSSGTGENSWEFGTRLGEGALSISNVKDNATRFLIDSSGNVGIGSTTPAQSLTLDRGHQTFINLDPSNRQDYDAGVMIRNRLALTQFGNDDRLHLNTTGQFAAVEVGHSVAGYSSNLLVNGNVGIGTTSPRAKLDIHNGTVSSVSPALTIGGTISAVNAGHSIDFWGGGVNGSTEYARVAGVTDSGGNGGGLSFYTSTLLNVTSEERMRIDRLGNVGIGTTTPVGKLDIVGTNFAGIGGEPTHKGTLRLLDSGGMAASSAGGLEFKASNSGGGYGFRIANPDLGTGETPLYIQSRVNSATWTDRLAILNSGNVGIGTTTPESRLDVYGGDIRIRRNGGTPTLYLHNGAYQHTITNDVTTNALTFGIDGQEKMRISTTGSVGIGTTSPLTGFHVNNLSSGTITALTSSVASGAVFGDSTTNAIINMGVNDGNAAYLQARTKWGGGSALNIVLNPLGGNVGIGTSTPQYLVDVHGASAFRDIARFGFGQGFITWDGGAANTFNIGGDSGKALSFGSSGVYDRLYMDTSGNVGIGTTTPGTALSVVGAITNTLGELSSADGTWGYRLSNLGAGTGGIAFGTYGGSEWARITQGGNVGIGTTSPWRTLSVTGTVSFDGLTGATGAGSVCLDANKQLVYNSGSDACLSSTRATKHEIHPLIVDALSQILALEPVSFVYNEGDGRTRYGFIAEDTDAIDTRLATHDASGTVSGIDDRAILSVLVAAVKDMWATVQDIGEKVVALLQSDGEQNTKIQTLEARVQALESQLGTAAVPSNSPPPAPLASDPGEGDVDPGEPQSDENPPVVETTTETATEQPVAENEAEPTPEPEPVPAPEPVPSIPVEG